MGQLSTGASLLHPIAQPLGGEPPPRQRGDFLGSLTSRGQRSRVSATLTEGDTDARRFFPDKKTEQIRDTDAAFVSERPHERQALFRFVERNPLPRNGAG